MPNLTAPRFGIPKEGSAYRLVVNVPRQTEKAIQFHAEYSWNKHGFVPLVVLPREYQPRGMVVFEAPANIQARLQTVGLRRLAVPAMEPASSRPDEEISGWEREEEAPRKNAMSDAFVYTEQDGRLELFTEPLTASGTAGHCPRGVTDDVRRSQGDAREPTAHARQSR